MILANFKSCVYKYVGLTFYTYMLTGSHTYVHAYLPHLVKIWINPVDYRIHTVSKIYVIIGTFVKFAYAMHVVGVDFMLFMFKLFTCYMPAPIFLVLHL